MNTGEIIGMVCSGLCCLGMLGGVVLIVVGTIFKTRFGVNFSPPQCGECGAKAPVVRAPKSTYEVLWGGWTCAKCGCENDKWGNPR